MELNPKIYIFVHDIYNFRRDSFITLNQINSEQVSTGSIPCAFIVLFYYCILLLLVYEIPATVIKLFIFFYRVIPVNINNFYVSEWRICKCT